MDWYRLTKKLQERYANHKDGGFALNLKYFRIKYRGGGQFFYSYHSKKYIRTGMFLIKAPWPLSALKLTKQLHPPRTPPSSSHSSAFPSFRLSPIVSALALFVFLITSSYFIFRSPDFTEELQEFDAVGGFGEVNQKYPHLFDETNTPNSEKLEEDEKVKNSLLGISASDDIKGKKISYKVQPGDTLSEISKKFQVSVESIAGSSGIRTPDSISVGQTLKIPPKNGFYYKVQKNDRLSTILSKYKLELASILKDNPHIDPDLLQAGEEVFLPGAKPKNLIYGWLVPVNSRIITSGYGWRNWPRRAFHKGLDLKAYYTRVRSAKAGRVTYAGWLGGYGKAVVLRHTGGYRSLYAHLSKIYVKKGMRVAQGATLGKSGNTGYSFGPHLHFEVSRNGKNINPRRFFKALRYKKRSRR